MDYQRILLILAAAALSFMLMTEWVQYKEEHTAINTEPSTQQFASVEESTPVDVAVDQDSDVPSGESEATEPSTVLAPRENPIRIETDTLQLMIDPKGGDIIYAALPKFLEKIDVPDKPLELLESNEERVFIAQSGLIGQNGTDTRDGRPHFTSAQNYYRMEEGSDELVVDLNLQQGDVSITKRFRFQRGEYLLDIEYLIDNQSADSWQAGMFAQLKRDNSADPSVQESSMGMAPYLGAALHLPDEPYSKISFKDMAEETFKETLEGGWFAIVQHYFVSAWIPNPEQSHQYSTKVTRGGFNIVRITSPVLTVGAGETGTIDSSIYLGPKDQYRLEEISPGLELTVDYGWLWWIAQPLFWLLNHIYALVGNWGWAIIVLTILVKAAFFQLNATAYKSMANMRRLQPELAAIRERNPDDRQKQSQEMMNLYKKEKINPMGGCLPILVQMPVFIALYWVLLESVELRHAPWILWIDDLSAMDPYFVLPLIMGASMFIQQKLNPTPPDPMQAKVMQWMPIIFTFFFLWFPAGLVVYWVINNILSIAQQYVITKRIAGDA